MHCAAGYRASIAASVARRGRPAASSPSTTTSTTPARRPALVGPTPVHDRLAGAVAARAPHRAQPRGARRRRVDPHRAALVYLLDQSATQATAGSLVVVGITSAVGAFTTWRNDKVLLARGVTFGLVAIGGATVGALASSRVPEPVLLGSFAALLVVVASVSVMVTRQVRARRADRRDGYGDAGAHRHVPKFDDPIITFSPTFMCQCPRALKVLVTATAVGLLTGFLGVGGGFLVVPALILALSLPMGYAAGTSLVVITIASAATALLVRAGSGPAPDWTLVALLTLTPPSPAAWIGARVASNVSTDRLQAAFTTVLVAVGIYTAWQALPALT